MNLLRLSILSMFVAIAAVTCADAADNCKSCRNRSIGSPERHLKDIRGTASITSLSFSPDPNVIISPVRGKKNFSITNALVENSSIAGTLSSIFNTTVTAANEVSIIFDVVFDCPFDSTPTVVLSLEENSSVIPASVIVNSFGVVASNVSPNGFTVNVELNIYGASTVDIFDILLGSSVDFIAQGR